MWKRGMLGRGLWLPMQASIRMVCRGVRTSQLWMLVRTWPPAGSKKPGTSQSRSGSHWPGSKLVNISPGAKPGPS
jgi:hypothetical protein